MQTPESSVGRFAWWSAILTAVVTAAALALAVTTPPRSGPFCTGECIVYPYTDAAAFVPRDYLWMYPALFMAVLFVILAASVHEYASADAKRFSRIALSFAVIASTLLTLDYFVQLTVLQPSLLKGETEGLSLFSQYNPHGVFIALEDLGYLMMSAAFLFMAPVFAGATRLERVLRWLFTTSVALTVGFLVVLAVVYRSDLEYRFEVAAISIVWLTLIAGGVLLSFVFRRASASATIASSEPRSR
jgi:hypothetical protein